MMNTMVSNVSQKILIVIQSYWDYKQKIYFCIPIKFIYLCLKTMKKVTSKKTPKTQSPSGCWAASSKELYFEAFQWTKWSCNHKRFECYSCYNRLRLVFIQSILIHPSQQKWTLFLRHKKSVELYMIVQHPIFW